MPDPIAAYAAIKFVWQESRTLREWLWSKLPSGHNPKRREAIEQELAKLLDDASALAKSLPPDELDAQIDDRLTRFRLDLSNVGLGLDEVELLAERGALFVRMMVTGPLGDMVQLSRRIGELERDRDEAAKLIDGFDRRLRRAEEKAREASEALEANRRQQSAGLIGLLLVFVVLAAFYLMNR